MKKKTGYLFVFIGECERLIVGFAALLFNQLLNNHPFLCFYFQQIHPLP